MCLPVSMTDLLDLPYFSLSWNFDDLCLSVSATDLYNLSNLLVFYFHYHWDFDYLCLSVSVTDLYNLSNLLVFIFIIIEILTICVYLFLLQIYSTCPIFQLGLHSFLALAHLINFLQIYYLEIYIWFLIISFSRLNWFMINIIFISFIEVFNYNSLQSHFWFWCQEIYFISFHIF